MVLSLDSVIAADKMIIGNTVYTYDALAIILLVALIPLLIIIFFVNTIKSVVEKQLSIKIIVLNFMIPIGFVLLSDAAHVTHLVLFDNASISIPK
jgi:predicted tellurium resistance membrane protein TerC